MASLASDASSSLPLAEINPQRIKSFKTFLASEEMVSIVPNFNYKIPMDFLLSQQSIGPLYAGQDATVPLWVALYLRKRNLCRLRCPNWMNVSHLKKVLAHERDANEESFSADLPFRYQEISRAILSAVGAGRSAVHAASGMDEEIEQAEVVRVLLEDINHVRMDKIRRNIHELSANVMANTTAYTSKRSMNKPMPVVSVSGIGSMEMSAIKPFLEGAFEDHLKLVRAGTAKSTGRGSTLQNNDDSAQQERSTSSRRMVSARRRERERGRDNEIESENMDYNGTDVEGGGESEENEINIAEEQVDGDNTDEGAAGDGDANESTTVSRRAVRRYRS